MQRTQKYWIHSIASISCDTVTSPTVLSSTKHANISATSSGSTSKASTLMKNVLLSITIKMKSMMKKIWCRRPVINSATSSLHWSWALLLLLSKKPSLMTYKHSLLPCRLIALKSCPGCVPPLFGSWTEAANLSSTFSATHQH